MLSISLIGRMVISLLVFAVALSPFPSPVASKKNSSVIDDCIGRMSDEPCSPANCHVGCGVEPLSPRYLPG